VLIITYERSEFLLDALAQMGAQDYLGHVQAIVVDDSGESSEAKVEALKEQGVSLPEVKYIYLSDRMSIGGKRNLAARSTAADVLCVWDDDDVFTVDRIRKQVEHLGCRGPSGGGVACSGIEVHAMYSVPTSSLSLRPARLPQLVFENTLCFRRSWWEDNKFRFGDSWKVSGQGEGTLEPWYEEVVPLTADQEPFFYIYLSSSVSGGTPEYVDPHPEPEERMFGVVRAFRCGRFPERLSGPHVRGVLEGARKALGGMLEDASLLEPASDEAPDGGPNAYDDFLARYSPVRERYIQERVSERTSG